MSKKTILVIGGTGMQGGSVARSLINSGNWNVRCITRNTNSKECMNLKSMGVELMKCDACDKQSLSKAMEGVYGVFSMTNYYDKESGGESGEYKMGCLIADVAKEKGVKHFVFSSLDNAERISGKKLKVPMFTTKSKVEDYVVKKGFDITTFVYLGFYMQNFMSDSFKPKKEGNNIIFNFPVSDSTKLALVNVENMGPVVSEIFKGEKKYNMARIPLVGSLMTLKQIVEQYQRATGHTTELRKISKNDFVSRYGNDLMEMMVYYQDCGPFKEMSKDMEMGKKLYPHMTTWDQFVKQTPLV